MQKFFWKSKSSCLKQGSTLPSHFLRFPCCNILQSPNLTNQQSLPLKIGGLGDDLFPFLGRPVCLFSGDNHLEHPVGMVQFQLLTHTHTNPHKSDANPIVTVSTMVKSHHIFLLNKHPAVVYKVISLHDLHFGKLLHQFHEFLTCVEVCGCSMFDPINPIFRIQTTFVICW